MENKVSVETIRKANQQMINESRLNNPNYMDITTIVFREIGGHNYKLKEEKNLQPQINVNGLIIINGRWFSKSYL